MQKLKKILFIILGAVFMSACSSGTQDEIMVIPNPADFTSLSPQSDISAHTEQTLRNMHSTLLKYNADTNEYDLDMAANIEFNDDSSSIDIVLKDNMTFHNGNPVTTEDVQYSFERMAGYNDDFISTDEIWVNLLDPNKSSFDIASDTEMTIYFNPEVYSSNIIYAIADCFIIPDEVSEDEQSKSPIGAGPYKFVSYMPGDYIEFEYYDGYYGDVPDVKNVKFKIFSDENASILSFKNEESDYLLLNSENYSEIENIEGVNIFSNLMNDVNVLYLNTNVEPFDNIEIRNAVNYAIDKERIISLVTNGVGATADTHMSKYMSNVYNDELTNTISTNIDESKKLLSKYGYDEDNKLDIDIITVSENAISNDMALVIQEELEESYIDVSISPMPWDQYLPNVYTNKNFDATILQLFGYSDPYKVMEPNISDNVGNLSGLKSEEYDNLLELSLSELDTDKRNMYFKEAQQILVDNATAIYLGDQGEQVALSPDYTNYKKYPFPFIDISEIKKVE